MKRKGNPHKDDPSNTPGEQQKPRGSEVAARGPLAHRQRERGIRIKRRWGFGKPWPKLS
tara:strand:+ start:290 stop:466 length:177 start_codon:yes stop_codon:yes gene_type:complete